MATAWDILTRRLHFTMNKKQNHKKMVGRKHYRRCQAWKTNMAHSRVCKAYLPVFMLVFMWGPKKGGKRRLRKRGRAGNGGTPQ